MSKEKRDLQRVEVCEGEELLFAPKQKRAKMDSDSECEKVKPSLAGGVETVEDRLGGGGKDKREDANAVVDPESAEETEQVEGATSSMEPQVLPPIKYEYLDHTADVQIHAWGDDISEAFEQCAMGMFAYMTDMERIDNAGSEQIEACGHDMLSLLYGFLDEWLFLFSADPYFVARKISITSFDRENFKIHAIGYGEPFDLSKHTQGTEVKAITYSNMQFHEKDGYAEVFVIIDI